MAVEPPLAATPPREVRDRRLLAAIVDAALLAIVWSFIVLALRHAGPADDPTLVEARGTLFRLSGRETAIGLIVSLIVLAGCSQLLGGTPGQLGLGIGVRDAASMGRIDLRQAIIRWLLVIAPAIVALGLEPIANRGGIASVVALAIRVACAGWLLVVAGSLLLLKARPIQDRLSRTTVVNTLPRQLIGVGTTWLGVLALFPVAMSIVFINTIGDCFSTCPERAPAPLFAVLFLLPLEVGVVAAAAIRGYRFAIIGIGIIGMVVAALSAISILSGLGFTTVIGAFVVWMPPQFGIIPSVLLVFGTLRLWNSAVTNPEPT